MIDTSPLLLWPVEVVERMPIEGVDDPRARRLAIVLGEAQGAGMAPTVLTVLADWALLTAALVDAAPGDRRVAAARAFRRARVRQAFLKSGPVTGGDVGATAGAEFAVLASAAALVGSGLPMPPTVKAVLGGLAAGPVDGPIEAAEAELAGAVLAMADTPQLVSNIDVWSLATAMLLAISEAAGAESAYAVSRATELAHAKLFNVRTEGLS